MRLYLLVLLAGCRMSPSTVISENDLGRADLALPAGSDLAAAPGADLSMMMMGGLCDTVPASLAASQMRSRFCSVGFDARDFLRAAPYRKVIVEVDKMTGTTPRQPALDKLVAIFQDLALKPDGVTVQIDDTLPALGHPATIDEIRAIEDGARDQFSLGDTIVFYVLYLADGAATDTSQLKTLGLAHRASSVVIFQKTIDDLSGGIAQPSSEVVESAVLGHELGHILGLVNVGTPMVQPHEDTSHPAHDVNQSCLMYWANNSSQLVANLLAGGVVADFDANCRADIAAVRDAP
jgi:hypothetical protein